MKVFLGSSGEAVKTGLLRTIAIWVEDAGHTPIRWNAPNVFPAGQYTFSSLRNIAESVDAALFIFAEDDQVWYRKDKVTQPRDNVLLEYGLFSASLGEGRVIICRSGSPRTASDLAGITYIPVPANAMARAEDEVSAWLSGIDSQPLQTNRAEHLDSPFQASGKRSLFLKGTQLIRKAETRVALVAKTPIILMGPRPYDESVRPLSYEAEQYDAYMNLVEACSKGKQPEFLCVATETAVADDIALQPDTLGRRVATNLDRLTQSAEQNGSRFEFLWTRDSGPSFLVADDHFMMWLKDDSGESVWITANSELISRALYAQARRIAAAGYSTPGSLT